MHNPVTRYFDMWNTGDVSIAREVLSPQWIDHAHPEVDGIAGVEEAVRAIRGLTFHIDSVLTKEGDENLVAAVGRVGANRLIWLVRLGDGLMAEMWTYTTNAPATADE
jgi:ketosteroid isomerase-like protein